MIVGIAGGSGAGKTTFVQRLVGELPHGSTTVLSHDAYYRDLTHLSDGARATVNFDHPDTLETELLAEHLRLPMTRKFGIMQNAPFSFPPDLRDGTDG